MPEIKIEHDDYTYYRLIPENMTEEQEEDYMDFLIKKGLESE